MKLGNVIEEKEVGGIKETYDKQNKQTKLKLTSLLILEGVQSCIITLV